MKSVIFSKDRKPAIQKLRLPWAFGSASSAWADLDEIKAETIIGFLWNEKKSSLFQYLIQRLSFFKHERQKLTPGSRMWSPFSGSQPGSLFLPVYSLYAKLR